MLRPNIFMDKQRPGKGVPVQVVEQALMVMPTCGIAAMNEDDFTRQELVLIARFNGYLENVRSSRPECDEVIPCGLLRKDQNEACTRTWWVFADKHGGRVIEH